MLEKEEEKNYYKPSYYAKHPEYYEMIVDRTLGESNKNISFWEIQYLYYKRNTSPFFKTIIISIGIAESVMGVFWLVMMFINSKTAFVDIISKVFVMAVAGIIIGLVIGTVISVIRSLIWEIEDLAVIYSVWKQKRKKKE